MNILLVLPFDNTYRAGRFFKGLSYAPLTLTTLASLVPPEIGATVTYVDEGMERYDHGRQHFDVVGITCVTSSAPRAYSLAAHYRSRGSFVVLGGVHPTLNPDDAAGHADCVVCGPAENTWPQILNALHAGKTVEKIYLDTMPAACSSPPLRRDLIRGKGYVSTPTVIASRGCVNRCGFCSIHRLCNGRVGSRAVEEVIEEIRALSTHRVLFLDPNIIADPEYAARLFEALIPLKLRWAGLATITLVENRELYDLTVRSGCDGLLVGFETINQECIRRWGKGFNEVSRYREAMRRFHADGIGVLGCFVVGFDEDTEDSFAKTVEFIDEAEIDIPRFAVLTPFPGTALFDSLQRQGRILTRDWKWYDTEHVVFKPFHMSPQRLQRGLWETWKAVYRTSRIMRRVAWAKRNHLLSLAINTGFRMYAYGHVARTVCAVATGKTLEGNDVL